MRSHLRTYTRLHFLARISASSFSSLFTCACSLKFSVISSMSESSLSPATER